MGGQAVQGFYDSLRKTLFALRLAGFFPIIGLLNYNSKLSKCVWITPYSLYYILSVAAVFGMTLIHLYDVIFTTRVFNEFGSLLYQSVASVALIFLLRLSLNWNNMLSKIDEIEKLLPPFKNGRLIVKKINYIMLYALLLPAVEHIMYMIYTIRVLSLCVSKKDKELTFLMYFQFYFGWCLDIIPLNFFTALCLQIFKIQITFVFHYIDALVIANTLYLVYRFRNFNRLMRLTQKKCNERTNWSHTQAHYTRLTRLVKIIDDSINPFVFLSFLSNLILICKAIYVFIQSHKDLSLNKNNQHCSIAYSSDFVAIAYHLISTAFLFSKMLIVSILTSYLHALSREPLNALNTLPSSGYNLQVQRFMDQVYHSKVSLSGLQFFYVTRGVIISMLSTIITYELVILQLQIMDM